ncbi:MAG: restriction endonuclease subunit S [Prevotella sp.]|nr:restriction endonuclease subunit S [Prevotella sp.]
MIEELKQLRSAIYQHLFQQLKGEKVALCTIADVIKGKQINGSELSDSGHYYMMNGGIIPSGYLEKCNTPANTISISEGGNSCGYVQYNHVPFWSGGHCYTLCLKGNIDSRYLYHWLKFKESDIMALRIGSGLPNIQKKDLEHFQIIMPNINIQKKYADIFDSIRNKEKNEIDFLKNWSEQKQYFLQQMFI